MYLNGNGLIYTKELAWYISCNVDYVLVEYLFDNYREVKNEPPTISNSTLYCIIK